MVLEPCKTSIGRAQPDAGMPNGTFAAAWSSKSTFSLTCTKQECLSASLCRLCIRLTVARTILTPRVQICQFEGSVKNVRLP
jgi:hypothetical protein